MSKTFKCRTVSPGCVQGEALCSRDAILFYHTDAQTGAVTEAGHALEGVSVRGKILVFPGGKGSSVVQADGMYRLDKHGTAPLALIVRELDTVLVSSAIIMEVPMICDVEEEFYQHVRDGDVLRVDTEKGEVSILA